MEKDRQLLIINYQSPLAAVARVSTCYPDKFGAPRQKVAWFRMRGRGWSLSLRSVIRTPFAVWKGFPICGWSGCSVKTWIRGGALRSGLRGWGAMCAWGCSPRVRRSVPIPSGCLPSGWKGGIASSGRPGIASFRRGFGGWHPCSGYQALCSSGGLHSGGVGRVYGRSL